MAFANTVIGALQPVATRWSAQRLDPLLFCAGATGIAALCISGVLSHRGELRHLIELRYLPRLITISMAGTVATSLALFYGLRQVNAVTGVLLLQTEPIYSLILAALFIGERPSPRQLVATATIIAGVAWVLSGGGSFAPSRGALLVLLTPLFWQLAHVIALPMMPPLSPFCITGARYIYAAAVLLTIFALSGAGGLNQLIDPMALAVVATSGVLIFFLGSLSWYGAISRLSLTWTTAIVVPGVPLLSMLFAASLLGEPISTRQALGIAVATSGVLAMVLGVDSTRGGRSEPAEAVHQPLA